MRWGGEGGGERHGGGGDGSVLFVLYDVGGGCTAEVVQRLRKNPEFSVKK